METVGRKNNAGVKTKKKIWIWFFGGFVGVPNFFVSPLTPALSSFTREKTIKKKGKEVSTNCSCHDCLKMEIRKKEKNRQGCRGKKFKQRF